MNACHYCGAEDWFAWEDNVLCGECLSPETLPAVTYDNYLSLTAAEMELKRKRFVEGGQPDPHETPEYFDVVWRERKAEEQPTDLPPPFWHTIGD